jgi:putative tryptophan/tyrosine transport system substrate-binding protein
MAARSVGAAVQKGPATFGTLEATRFKQARNPDGGLIVMPAVFNVANRELIIALTARHGVPAIYFNKLFPKSGGLIAYRPDNAEQFRRATT